MKKEKHRTEFVLGDASQMSLWLMLRDSTSLEQWFAVKVKVTDRRFYTFTWEDNFLEAE